MAKRQVGNLLALAVLSYLSERPMHPYELGRTLRDHGDDRSLKFIPSSLYMVVQQLAKAGFITEVETNRAGLRPERTVYALTGAGRAELADWLRELVAEPEHEYPRFVTALSLIGALAPDDVVVLLDRRRERLEEQRAEARHIVETALAADVHPLFLIEEDYRLALLDTEIAFVDRFRARITDPADGWGPAWAAHLERNQT
ncbi:MAG: PadR family transcriptional regulator [Hamadaea sp.]|nr:PadR family transcriptional regulator [Hamadaea sp.]